MSVVKEALLKTREMFASTHWTQGHWSEDVDGKTRYCLVGGYRVAYGVDSDFDAGESDYDAGINLIFAEVAPDVDIETLDFDAKVDHIITWNDDEGRSLEEVLGVLYEAASKAPA